MAASEGGTASWKHIGLHGHSVGTFTCAEAGVQWKSALYGREEGVATVSTSTRNIPKNNIEKAAWSVFGKSGHLRVNFEPREGKASHQHEMRFDGFPIAAFEILKDAFQENYDIEVTKLNLSSAGTQYGQSKIKGKKLVFKHCILEDADEEGEVSIKPCCIHEQFEFRVFTMNTCIASHCITLYDIASCGIASYRMVSHRMISVSRHRIKIIIDLTQLKKKFASAFYATRNSRFEQGTK